MKKSAPTFKFLLGISLAVSLSGCAGWGTRNTHWSNNQNNNSSIWSRGYEIGTEWTKVTGGVRNYGPYPTPNLVTCSIKPATVNAIEIGLRKLAAQKAREGISPFTLIKDYLIPAGNQLFIQNNPQPLNALYAQIQPQTLANFMIGCNEVTVQEGKILIKDRKILNEEAKILNKKLETMSKKTLALQHYLDGMQHYLDTTPAPQPSLQTFQYSYIIAHPEIEKAMEGVADRYMGKPLLLFSALLISIEQNQLNNVFDQTINTINNMSFNNININNLNNLNNTVNNSIDQINNLFKINTIQGLQQQLQQRHLTINQILQKPLLLKPLPPINFARFRMTFGGVLLGAAERVVDPYLIISSMRKLEQKQQRLYQMGQQIHQQLQQTNQQLQHLHYMQEHHITESPQEIINDLDSLPNHGGLVF
ncbi:MAG: hypothetical protein IJ934_07435 [Acetobacter sp.]|nr:hypothetical protein [Acetobacter sp.]